MLFYSFYLLALHLLLQAHQTLANEDHTLMETEFRLFLFTGDPDNVQVTYDDEDGVELVGSNQNPITDQEFPGSPARSEDGKWPLTYMAWSRVNKNLRTVWIHNKGTDKKTGRKVSTVNGRVARLANDSVPYI
jgi:hypothetical protein